MTIGEKIYKFRNSLHLTQKQFADKIEVAQSSVNFWENGKRQPKIEQLKKIANTFNIPLASFLDEDLFLAVTSPDEVFENHVVDKKIKNITDNNKTSAEEKSVALLELIPQLEIMQNIHENNVKVGGKQIITNLFERLNVKGQKKAIEQVELLTKIPEYTEAK